MRTHFVELLLMNNTEPHDSESARTRPHGRALLRLRRWDAPRGALAKDYNINRKGKPDHAAAEHSDWYTRRHV